VRQIAENAGSDGAVVAGKLTDKVERNRGFDAQSGTYVDMLKAGIIDPTKVVRTALQDAASVAGILVTTEKSPCPAAAIWAEWAAWVAWAA
jgi:chaperonin GroEL